LPADLPVRYTGNSCVRIIILTILAALAGLSASAQNRRDAGGAAPPPVVSQIVVVKRGEKVSVPLASHGTRSGRLEFLIRSLPAQGRLSAVTSTGLNGATVIYTAPSRGTASEDRFTYAVRTAEGVSAPGLVTVKFLDPPVIATRLKVPGELDFPPVFPGQRSVVEMELINEGGGMAEGEVSVPAPWGIEGIALFRVGGGQRATIKIFFESERAGVSNGEATLTGTMRKRIPLRAVVEEGLAVTPPQLKLTAQSGSQTRTGTIQISNRSHEDATVVVAGGPRLITDHSVQVPARGTAAIPVFADAGDSAAFEETVKLSSGHWTATVPVRATAVGAIVKFAGERVSIAGMAGGISASGSATIENSGGEPATVQLDIDPPFELDTRVITVPGRGSKEIPIRAPRAAPGVYRTSLRAMGEGTAEQLEVTAELTSQASAEAPKSDAPPPETEKIDADSEASEPADALPPWMPRTFQEIPNAMGKLARRSGEDSATLEWPASLGVPADARLEERVLSPGQDDQLQIDWVPLAHVRIAAEGDRVTAELQGLKPGWFYTVRAVSGQGADVTTFFTTDFWTRPKKPLLDVGWRSPALTLALAVLAYSIWRTRRAAKS